MGETPKFVPIIDPKCVVKCGLDDWCFFLCTNSVQMKNVQQLSIWAAQILVVPLIVHPLLVGCDFWRMDEFCWDTQIVWLQMGMNCMFDIRSITLCGIAKIRCYVQGWEMEPEICLVAQWCSTQVKRDEVSLFNFPFLVDQADSEVSRAHVKSTLIPSLQELSLSQWEPLACCGCTHHTIMRAITLPHFSAAKCWCIWGKCDTIFSVKTDSKFASLS